MLKVFRKGEKMRKKVCVCGVVFRTEKNENRCPSCVKWREYICNHPQPENKQITVLPEFRIFFKNTAISDLYETSETCLSGAFITKPDRTWSIHVYLNRIDLIDPDVLQNTCKTISHEYLHMLIEFAFDTHAEGLDANKKSDNGLMKRLSDEGYFGG